MLLRNLKAARPEGLQAEGGSGSLDVVMTARIDSRGGGEVGFLRITRDFYSTLSLPSIFINYSCYSSVSSVDSGNTAKRIKPSGDRQLRQRCRVAAAGGARRDKVGSIVRCSSGVETGQWKFEGAVRTLLTTDPSCCSVPRLLAARTTAHPARLLLFACAGLQVWTGERCDLINFQGWLCVVGKRGGSARRNEP